MKNFQHFDVKTVDEAVSLLDKYKEKACVSAGSTDLLDELKDKVHPTQPEVLVNIKPIPGLNTIKEDAEGLKIGALATLFDIENNETVKAKYSVLAQAAHAVGVPQLRVMGTLGGNLLQHVRCWYYRATNNYFFCVRKGGAMCYAVPGDNRFNAIIGGKICFAVCPSDTAIALTALDAKVVVQGKAGKRTIPLGELYTVLGTTLKPDEMLTEIQVPTPKAGTKGAFKKFRIRKAFDFAIASAAAVMTIEAGTVKDCRVVLGGVAPTPYRATKAEDALKGKAISEDVAKSAAAAAVTEAIPLSKNAYIIDIAKAMVKDAILSA